MVSLGRVGKGGLPRKALGAAAAFALALGVAGHAPSEAHAGDAAGDWNSAVAESQSPDYAPYSSAAGGARAYGGSSLPERLDLRERGVVTPPKRQNPWGTCWGFSAIAASETSILSELNATYEDFPLDLSERHLVHFSYAPAPGFAGDQEGEGVCVTQGTASAENPNLFFDYGGHMEYATTMFSAGIGPLYEDMVPYRNDEGVIECTVAGPEEEEAREYLTEEQIEAREKEGYAVRRLYYAENHPDPEDPSKTVYPTWGVDEQYWLASAYELEESRILPDVWVRDESGNTVELDRDSVNAIKGELYEGRAVSMSIFADPSDPIGQGSKLYIDEETWAHYTYDEGTGINHAVTIIGWDDGYPRENFLSPEDNPRATQPPGDGAWLVKNSKGAETEEFPNRNAWGVVDGQGRHTGYFWVSYYDKSQKSFETFDFDLEDHATEEGEYAVDQHNYLVAGYPVVSSFDEEAPSANVFAAAEDMAVRTMACETTRPNTTVTYELYLLGEGDENPTDGELAATAEETYEFGGYHRATLPEDEWVPMRAGQRYAVVVTQYCNDDGRYYQSVASKRSLPTKEEAEQKRESYKDDMRSRLAAEKKEELVAGGMSEEEAEALAEKEAWEYVQTPEMEEYIAREVERKYGKRIDTGFKAVVNPGESYTASGDGTWTDWSEVVATLPKDMVYDNFPIKAFADYRDYADISTLSELQQTIDDAAAELEGVAVSADGSDVPADELWVTRADYDVFAAAVQAARELMAKAGEGFENELAVSTPGQEEAEAAIDALNAAAAAFEEAKKPGTKGETTPTPEDPKDPFDPKEPAEQKGPANPEGDPKGKVGAAFSKTSDPVAFVFGSAATVAAIAVVIVFTARKRLN